VITFINKWDRPGLEPLALLDEIERRTDRQPTPLTWPVGIPGHFHGVVDRSNGAMVRFERTPGGARAAVEEILPAAEAAVRFGEDWTRAAEELDLLALIGADHDQVLFEAGQTTPVLFGAAVANLGVRQLLDTLAERAVAPASRVDAAGVPRPINGPFSGFRVQDSGEHESGPP
jgi:peptide chain release factor 3